jgi:hypothetical protein
MEHLLTNEDCLNYFLKYIINLNTYHEYIEILYILCDTCHDLRETILSNKNQFPKKKELMIVYTKFISIPRMYNTYSYKIDNYQKNIFSNTRKGKNKKRSKVRQLKNILNRLKIDLLSLDELYEFSDEEFEEGFLIESTSILKTLYFLQKIKIDSEKTYYYPYELNKNMEIIRLNYKIIRDI